MGGWEEPVMPDPTNRSMSTVLATLLDAHKARGKLYPTYVVISDHGQRARLGKLRGLARGGSPFYHLGSGSHARVGPFPV